MAEDERGHDSRRASASDTDVPENPKKHSAEFVISIMLIVPDSRKAIDWYMEALGATVLWDLGGVAGLRIAGAPFFLHEVNPENPSEKSPAAIGGTSVRIEVFTDEPDNFINRAEAAGATITSPIEEHQLAWGVHRQGGFTDPFGHNWSVGDRTPLGEYGD